MVRKAFRSAGGAGGLVGGEEQLVDELDDDVETVELSQPSVAYRSLNESEFDSCLDWRADVQLFAPYSPDSWDVVAGHVDFLTLRLGEEPVAEVLDSLSHP